MRFVAEAIVSERSGQTVKAIVRVRRGFRARSRSLVDRGEMHVAARREVPAIGRRAEARSLPDHEHDQHSAAAARPHEQSAGRPMSGSVTYTPHDGDVALRRSCNSAKSDHRAAAVTRSSSEHYVRLLLSL
jgi:hypothetical protein